MADPFQLLTDADLSALSGAILTGRLTAPFSSASVRGYCSSAVAGPVAARIQQLAEEGMRPSHLALLMETVVLTRSRHHADLLDLVWTGPETPGVVNRDTGVVVRQLFEGAREHVLVAGYAVHQGRAVFARLAQRMVETPLLIVRMFLEVQRPFGDDTPGIELLKRFADRFSRHEWPGPRLPELYYDPRSLELDAEKRSSLHAKCVVVDRECVFLSSANFTEAAQVRNIEAGVLVRSPLFACQLVDHFESLAGRNLLLRLSL